MIKAVLHVQYLELIVITVYKADIQLNSSQGFPKDKIHIQEYGLNDMEILVGYKRN